MYELKKNGKVFTSKSVGTGPLFSEKRIYWAAVSQRLRNTDIGYHTNEYTRTYIMRNKRRRVFAVNVIPIT